MSLGLGLDSTIWETCKGSSSALAEQCEASITFGHTIDTAWECTSWSPAGEGGAAGIRFHLPFAESCSARCGVRSIVRTALSLAKNVQDDRTTWIYIVGARRTVPPDGRVGDVRRAEGGACLFMVGMYIQLYSAMYRKGSAFSSSSCFTGCTFHSSVGIAV